MSGERRPVLSVRGLTVATADRTLLAPSSFDLHEGERALLVGPSGSGKSLFLDVLLGFVGPSTPGLLVRGEVRLDDVDLLPLEPSARDGRIGAVFQIHRLGLFDDLSVAENLRFGSLDAARAGAAAAALGLDGLERPAPSCSGGERLRAALARTLLRGAETLVLDEPTTGLDPASCAQAVEALRRAHRRLTLVVTHDAAAFDGFADVVLRLDPGSRTIVREDAAPGAAPTAAPPAPAPSLAARVLAAWTRACDAAGDAALDLAAALAFPWALLRLAHPLDGPRVRRALRRDLAPGVATFVAVAAVLVSLTTTYFLFDRIPRREYVEPLVREGMLAGLGQVLTRVVVPLISTILLAAKLGASSAAHLGQMSLTRQVDALRLLGVPVRRHLLVPSAAAMVLGGWIHVALALVASFGAATVVFLWTHPGWSFLYVQHAYVRESRASDALWLAAKVGACALATAATAFHVGTAPKREPEEVVRGIHGTLLRALLQVLAIHAAFAFAEF